MMKNNILIQKLYIYFVNISNNARVKRKRRKKILSEYINKIKNTDQKHQ
jgi:hypothetical protein